MIKLKTVFLMAALLANLMTRGYVSGDALNFEEMEIAAGSGREKAYVITIDPASPEFTIKPVLSLDQVFGFETLEEMAERSGAIAAINGGFFHSYGQPVGQVVIDGEWITMPTGEDPVFFIDRRGRPRLLPVKARAYVEINGERFYLDGLNRSGGSTEAVLYTHRYGSTTRQKPLGYNVIISENRVRGVVKGSFTEIPSGGKVLYIGEKSFLKNLILPKIKIDVPLKSGVAVDYPPGVSAEDMKNAFETGPYMIKDGKVTIKRWEKRIGLTTIPVARSAVGLSEDGRVIFVTVEGTGPGRGVSLQRLSAFLLGMGVRQAAALDGGASATMYYGGRIVNRPSLGFPRPIGTGVVIKGRLWN
ncbi:phosphodiester glycosidase family protein [Thermoanaerobacterium sp. DL9XJH110]|uniref:phosphodiester glycosidase family protein n=1 Tax=Thermoanaerobacterium sp. DL9XJH110 TaxID=3386643 RepID=UPI003BB5F41F